MYEPQRTLSQQTDEEGSLAMNDDEAPLLRGTRIKVSHIETGTASMMSCIANLANTILGTGMLAMPHAFASGGLLPGLVTVCWCGTTAAFGLYLLSRSAAEAPHRSASFAALSKLTFPRLGKLFDLAIFLKCYGVSISYLIIVGALVPRLILAFSPDADDWVLDRRVWILAAMSLLTPIAFLRRLDSLKWISYVALCAVANLVFVVVYKFFETSGMPPRPPVRLFNLSSKFVSSLPVQIFAFTCAQNIFSVHNELRQNTQRRLNTVIGSSIGSATIIYLILGIIGFLSFGEKVGSNIIEMYPHSRLIALCQAGIVVLVLFSYPLQLHPCRASLHKVLHSEPLEGAEERDSDEIPLVSFVAETAFILVTTFIISLFVDKLETVLGFVGATGSTTISFILPSLFFLSIFKNSASAQDQKLRLLAMGLLAWGVLVMVVSLSLNIWHLVRTEEEGSLALLGHLGGKVIPPMDLDVMGGL